MTTYSVTDTKLEQQNVLIDKGGHIPSEVSNALASLQIAIASGAQVAATAHLNAAIEANKKNAGVYTEMQGWHDSVKASGGPVEPPVPPVQPPSYASPGLQHPPMASFETRRLTGSGDTLYWVGVAVPGNVSMALGSGSGAVYGAVVDAQPVGDPIWQATGSGVTMPLPIKVGQFFVWKFTGAATQEMRPQLLG